ncbi:girdin-like isoform X2 [Cimex lectularius]|uniref:Uncharacterized protein n=1 Tax=Cimex lectularius TaxID=79782 RepID=A0A8I6S2X6_CIMLE|nr:girdin-like isoform X2 [Cimex lectularius]
MKTGKYVVKEPPRRMENENNKPKNSGDSSRSKLIRSATTKKQTPVLPKKPYTCDGPPKKNQKLDALTKMKSRYVFLAKKYNRVAKEVQEKQDGLSVLHNKLVELKGEILEVNCKENIEVPQLKIGIISQRVEVDDLGDSGDAGSMNTGRNLLTLQKEYNKVYRDLAEVVLPQANAIKKELNDQLYISEKKCRELHRQLAEERSHRSEDGFKCARAKLEELEQKQATLDEINYQKFLAEEENEKISQVNDSLKLEMANIKMKNQELERELAELKKTELSKSGEEKDEKTMSIHLLQEENKALKDVLSELRTDHKMLQQAYNDLKTDFDTLLINKDKDILDNEKLTKSLIKATQEADNYKREVECFKNELKIAIKEKAELSSTVFKLKEKVAKFKTSHGTSKKTKLIPCKILPDNISSLTTQFKALQDENEKLLMEIEKKDEQYDNQMKRFEQRAHEYISESRNLSSTIEKFQRNKEKLESELKSLKNRLASYDAKLKGCQCPRLKEEMNSQNLTIRCLNKKLKSMSYKYQMLKEEYQKSRMTIQDYSSRG